MQSKRTLRTSGLWTGATRSVLNEAILSWHFIWRDLSATIIPAVLFMLAAGMVHHVFQPTLPLMLGRGLLYFWLYCYTFCLSNQLAGMEEDRHNKPDRPLVSGMVSIRGAWLRWVVFMTVFTLVGWWFDVLLWTVLWQIVLTLHNFGGWAKHWVGKHLCMSLGTVAELAAAWQLVTPLTPSAWRWILVLAGAMFALFAAQDLRDMDGDRVSGRRTLPLVLGERRTRWFLSAGFGMLPIVVHLLLIAPTAWSMGTILCDVGLAGLSWIIAARLLLRRSRRADHVTYMLFTYWYCGVLASALVIL